jgi:hypothetical protein
LIHDQCVGTWSETWSGTLVLRCITEDDGGIPGTPYSIIEGRMQGEDGDRNMGRDPFRNRPAFSHSGHSCRDAKNAC